jgi:serine/threonine protein kinase
VKVIDKLKFSKREQEALANEVTFLRKCNHNNIIRFHNFFDEEPEKCYLVLELVTGGELFDRISAKTVYSEKDARDLIQTLLDILVHLEEHKIAHRDLKPENLLLKNHTSDSDIVLIDFGFAANCNGRELKDQCGTPNYVAPEILSKRSYGCEVDLWSAGVIAYIILGGYPVSRLTYYNLV